MRLLDAGQSHFQSDGVVVVCVGLDEEVCDGGMVVLCEPFYDVMCDKTELCDRDVPALYHPCHCAVMVVSRSFRRGVLNDIPYARVELDERSTY